MDTGCGVWIYLVAFVPSIHEFNCVINIQFVKENFLFTGQIHRLGDKYLLTY